jgi:ribonuclease G
VLGRAKEDRACLIVVVHPDVMNRLKTEDGELLVDLERKYQARLTFRSDPSFHREHFTLTNAQTGEEIRN